MHKTILLRFITIFHRLFFLREMPNHLSIYLHDIKKDDREIISNIVLWAKENEYIFVDPIQFLHKDYDKSIFLSFDDNYRNWFHAKDLFDELDIRVTFYTNTLFLGDLCESGKICEYYPRISQPQSETLSSNELISLHEAGHTIGGHTHSHFKLNEIPIELAKEDIHINKMILDSIIGKNVEHFSFPYGMRRHFNEELTEFCRNIGYKTISSALPCMQHHNHGSPYIHRQLIKSEKSLKTNLEFLRIDGSLFVNLFGRSPIG